ncbi:MAG: hypothetical protein ABSE64_10585 [Vulcanimicrobiaceae bacterium]|jgi:hypothetical protein
MSTSGPTPPIPVTGTVRRRSGGIPIPKRVAWFIIAVLFVAIVISVTTRHESRQERLVTRIITAVQRNDMTPVASDFDAQARESMTHAKVGHLADLLAPMGALKNVEETTPKDAAPRDHEYLAHFEKGNWQVKMPVDIDGKAESFYMRRSSGQ